MTAFLHADTRRSARRKRHHGRLANEPSTATVWAGLLSIQPRRAKREVGAFGDHLGARRTKPKERRR
jgi:hypothetical protein